MNPGGGLVALTPSPGGGVGRLVAFVGKELLNPETQKHSKLLLLMETHSLAKLKDGTRDRSSRRCVPGGGFLEMRAGNSSSSCCISSGCEVG